MKFLPNLTQTTLALLGAATVLTSCATANRTIVGTVRPAVSPEVVRVYETPPRRYEEIAIVEAKTIGELRAQAAAVGANGLILRGVLNRPGPVIGLGFGGSTYDVGRRSAVGIGTGVGFSTPIPNRVIQGAAVYVR